jgi:selenocysteine lyase/cysteine desulfurase
MSEPTITIDEFADSFDEEPGYLDFARIGAIDPLVREEDQSLSTLLGRARFGTIATLEEQEARAAAAAATLVGFPVDQVVFQPSTSQGLIHVMFGLTGEVALSPGEFPSSTFAVQRAADALGTLTPRWLETEHGRITPGTLRDQLTDTTTAVCVSLVDSRTGYLADLDGIRQVIGDRLLIVDAIQGFGVVDAPYELADVVVSGGQKWVRAGFGTGFLALSDRAIDQVRPTLSGFTGTDVPGTPFDEVPSATRGVGAFRISNPDLLAQARFATALEHLAAVGVPAIRDRIAMHVSRIIDLADEFAVEVVSSRDETERAGIVVLAPEPDQLTVLAASLHNHGVTVTTRGGRVRISPHASTEEESFAMLRASLVSFSTTI